MSVGEPDRLAVIREVLERRMTQTRAAVVLGLSARQVRRLSQAYRRHGAPGLASRRRGQPSNRRLPDDLRERAIGIVRDQLSHLGPTGANRQLRVVHGIQISKETLRTWMVRASIWTPTRKRRA